MKHRNASKYLQLQAKRAKFDKTSKNNLNDQLSRHRELLTKHGEKMEESDDDQGEGEEDRGTGESIDRKLSFERPWERWGLNQSK